MPHRFPQEASLRDGKRVLIRPFTEDDTEALWRFFQGLPAERRRFAWDNVDDRSVIESWGRDLDYEKTVPLLAVAEQRIVADATLHLRHRGPLRRVGRLAWFLDPDYRGVGLGTLLVNTFIDMARNTGLHHLSCLLISDLETDAIATLRDLGFQEYVLPDYGTDPDGKAHDMVKLVLRL